MNDDDIAERLAIDTFALTNRKAWAEMGRTCPVPVYAKGHGDLLMKAWKIRKQLKAAKRQEK